MSLLATSLRTVVALPFLVTGFLLLPFSALAQTPNQKPIGLDARLANPVMKAGTKQQNYLRVALNGCEPKRSDNRTPVNVAFVIDRSGSMAGQRIMQAREAAILALKRLDQNDIASVVIFDNQVDVLAPAQPVSDQNHFIDLVRGITVRGSTAIYDGVMQGAREVRKFKDARRLNRVVLLSDGLANVGPKQPEEFARLGRDLLAEGISVSTIGLGLDYNEDLMLALARAADGNHAFASVPNDLIQIFNREFDDVLAACAQTVSIDVELAPGARVVRALSRDGKVEDKRAQFTLNQVYAATEHYVLLEIEIDGNAPAATTDFGRVNVTYTVPDSGERQTIAASIGGQFTTSADAVKAGQDKTVMEAVVAQVTRERAQTAVKLRDQGKGAEAAKLFLQNAEEIGAFIATAPKSSPALQSLQTQYGSFAKTAPSAPAGVLNTERKLLRQLENSAVGGSRF
jgi:Ca-activated chloride channel family protein